MIRFKTKIMLYAPSKGSRVLVSIENRLGYIIKYWQISHYRKINIGPNIKANIYE